MVVMDSGLAASWRPGMTNGWDSNLGRRDFGHRLALRKRGDRRRADRAFLVVEPAFADRDTRGGPMVHHVETDPFGHGQAMQIQGDVAVDETEPLLSRIGKRA